MLVRFVPRMTRLRSGGRRGGLLAVALSVACAGAVGLVMAQARAAHEEDRVRTAARTYYGATAAGDAVRCLAVARLPMTVVSNGQATFRNEAQLRALLAKVAARPGSAPLSAEERTRVDERLRGMFEEAEVTFVGADTASVTFLVRAGAKPEDGDLLAMLLLHRRGGEWRVIGEVRDSTPVPASYLRRDEGPAPAER